MLLGQRLRDIRESRHISQGDIEKSTGLLRCYISRVECGHTTPSIETVEKFARALGVQTYQIFMENGSGPVDAQESNPRRGEKHRGKHKDSKNLLRLRYLLGKMRGHDRELLLSMASMLAKRHH